MWTCAHEWIKQHHAKEVGELWWAQTDPRPLCSPFRPLFLHLGFVIKLSILPFVTTASQWLLMERPLPASLSPDAAARSQAKHLDEGTEVYIDGSLCWETRAFLCSFLGSLRCKRQAESWAETNGEISMLWPQLEKPRALLCECSEMGSLAVQC